MGPTDRYPNGYVRFRDANGHYLDLFGKPGPNETTHFAIDPDGDYPIPPP